MSKNRREKARKEKNERIAKAEASKPVDAVAARLYVITPPRFELTSFLPQLEQAFEGGDIACLQLRLKYDDPQQQEDARFRRCRRYLPHCPRI